VGLLRSDHGSLAIEIKCRETSARDRLPLTSERPAMQVFRKLLPAEMVRYKAHLLRLDRADRHLRFAGSVSDAVIEQHCLRLDWRDTIIIGWFDNGELRGASELRTAGTPFPKRAELAFSVETPYQGRGIGYELMSRALTIARNRGIKVVDVICMLENRRMRSLARKFTKAAVIESGEVGVSIVLDMPNQVTLFLEALEDGAGLMSTVLGGFKAGMARVMN